MAEFFSNLKDDFIQSFVEGDRWLLYLKGVGITLEVAAWPWYWVSFWAFWWRLSAPPMTSSVRAGEILCWGSSTPSVRSIPQ